ncbi:MAG TPA: quinone oxidoreductase [Gammaproteobacteria bacterium]|nr:quinone oxidoreductase [Gammaproteobacteria bacterium]
MTKAIRIHQTGGPEVLKWEDVQVGDPGEGEIRVRHAAIGLNYIDVYFRSGLYPGPELPFSLGLEAAGVVEAVGKGVDDLSEGDRVAYAAPPIGAYAEARVMPARKAVKIPDGIEDRQAAAMMLQGMTSEYLLRRCYPVKKGQTILFHAAAGGVGLIACQWAKHLGATVIGTVGSKEKAELAKAHGCDHAILYNEESFVERVKELTDGKGVPVVYDGVGKSTFMGSLDCLQPRGMLVSYGQASGSVEPLNVGILSQKGSLYLTRPTLMTYTASREDTLESSGALFDVVEKGVVKIEINQSFALKDAADAHRALEGRKTTGSTVLIP